MENIIKRKNSLNGTIYFFLSGRFKILWLIAEFQEWLFANGYFSKRFSSNFEKLKLIRYPQKSQS